MADPNVVVAVGACGIGGGIFGKNYASLGSVDKVLPVDVYIPGFPPRPLPSDVWLNDCTTTARLDAEFGSLAWSGIYGLRKSG
jgi:Ni,Fe-hydrogenase III small subunit